MSFVGRLIVKWTLTSLNKLVEFYSNNTINLRPVSPRLIPTKWRSYRDVTAVLCITVWRRGVVVSGVRRTNEVSARRARLVLGWVTVFGRVYHLGL